MQTMSRALAVISRSPEPISFSAIYASTGEALYQAFPDSDPASWVVSDLSLGAWYGHWVATEFHRQLGLILPKSRFKSIYTSALASNKSMSYADAISKVIDSETGGNEVVQIALESASRVIGAIRLGPPRLFLVFMPRFGLDWEPENEIFLHFLVQGLPQTSSRLILVCAGKASPVPEKWHLHWLNKPTPPVSDDDYVSDFLQLVPGLIDRAWLIATYSKVDATHNDCLIPLANEQYLVAPECRRAPTTIPRDFFSQLATLAWCPRWLAAYAHFYGENSQTNIQLLVDEARQRFSEWSGNIAVRLFDRVIDCTQSPVQLSIVYGLMQGILIALFRYDRLRQIPEPLEQAPVSFRAYTFQNIGWSLVMSGKPKEATFYFQIARDLLKEQDDSREYLYLINITALNHFRLGEFHEAITLEQKIEKCLAQKSPRDWHLEYINSLNTARLYYRLGDYANAETYFQRAFATSLGMRSEIDVIYANYYLARVYTSHNQPDKAFHGWLRSALHWVALSAPEAMPQRVLRLIVGQIVPINDIVESVAAVFIDKLHLAMTSVGLDDVIKGTLPESVDQCPVFVHSRGAINGELIHFIDSVVGIPGASFLTTRQSVRPHFTGSQYNQLCWLLYFILKASTPASALDISQIIVIDDRLGQEMALTPTELLEVCVRLRARRLIYNETTIELCLNDYQQLEQQLHVRLSQAVDRVAFDGEQTTVFFKRYESPRTLSATEHQLISMLENSPTVEKITALFTSTQSQAGVLTLLRSLEQLRIIEMFFHQDTYQNLVINKNGN